MIDDLISRQAAIDAVHEDILLKSLNDSWYRENHEFVTVGYVERTLLALPSAQPKRKKGEWILYENQRQEDVDNDNYLYICSECGKSDLHAKTQKVPFCWNCGARMDGEE